MSWKSTSVKPCTSQARENNRFEGQSVKCTFYVLDKRAWSYEAGGSAGQGRKAKELEELKSEAMQLASNELLSGEGMLRGSSTENLRVCGAGAQGEGAGGAQVRSHAACEQPNCFQERAC